MFVRSLRFTLKKIKSIGAKKKNVYVSIHMLIYRGVESALEMASRQRYIWQGAHVLLVKHFNVLLLVLFALYVFPRVTVCLLFTFRAP